MRSAEWPQHVLLIMILPLVFCYDYDRRRLIPETLRRKICELDRNLKLCNMQFIPKPIDNEIYSKWTMCKDHPELPLCRWNPGKYQTTNSTTTTTSTTTTMTTTLSSETPTTAISTSSEVPVITTTEEPQVIEEKTTTISETLTTSTVPTTAEQVVNTPESSTQSILEVKSQKIVVDISDGNPIEKESEEVVKESEVIEKSTDESNEENIMTASDDIIDD